MTTKLKNEVEDLARELLGGQNPTPKRIEELFEELAQRRLAGVAGMAGDSQGTSVLPDDTPPTLAADEIEVPPMSEPIVVVSQTPPAVLTPSAPPSAEEQLRTMIEVQARTLAMMEQKIADLSKKQDPLAAERAVGEGKLPLPTTQAPPAGGTGFNLLPVGQWMTSPLGPKVPFIICGCGRCAPHRLYHYHCSICKAGPFDYAQQRPFFRKNWMAPGNIWGITHEVCSHVCYMQYLSITGQRAGVDMPAVAVTGEHSTSQIDPQPIRPVMAADSD